MKLYYYSNKTTFDTDLSNQVIQQGDLCFIQEPNPLIWTHNTFYVSSGSGSSGITDLGTVTYSSAELPAYLASAAFLEQNKTGIYKIQTNDEHKYLLTQSYDDTDTEDDPGHLVYQALTGFAVINGEYSGGTYFRQLRIDDTTHAAEENVTFNEFANDNLQADIAAIQNTLYTQYYSVGLSVSTGIIEKGISVTETITPSAVFSGQAVSASDLTNVSIKSGTTVLRSTYTSVTDSVSDSKSYVFSATYKGVTKTASASVNAFYPIYIGGLVEETITNSIAANNITAGTLAKSVKSSPSGTYTVTIPSPGGYPYFLVPSGMTINHIYSVGSLTVELPSTSTPLSLTVNGATVSYTAYRTNTGLLSAGNITLQIS